MAVPHYKIHLLEFLPLMFTDVSITVPTRTPTAKPSTRSVPPATETDASPT